MVKGKGSGAASAAPRPEDPEERAGPAEHAAPEGSRENAGDGPAADAPDAPEKPVLGPRFRREPPEGRNSIDPRDTAETDVFTP